MSMSKAKNVFYVVVGGLVSIAAFILIALQWGNTTDTFSLYGRTTTVNLALLMLASAIGGVIVWFCVKLLLTGSMGIWRYRRQQAKLDRMAERKVAEKQASAKASEPAAKPASSQSSPPETK